jgi:hypothetical protein
MVAYSAASISCRIFPAAAVAQLEAMAEVTLKNFPFSPHYYASDRERNDMKLRKLWCFVFGHALVSFDVFWTPATWQVRCMRCGRDFVMNTSGPKLFG